MSGMNLDSVAAVATIIAAVPIVASGVAISVPPVRKWLTDSSRPWAIPAVTALVTSLVTTAIVIGGFGAISSPDPLGSRERGLPNGIVVASILDCTKLGDGWIAFTESEGKTIIGIQNPNNRIQYDALIAVPSGGIPTGNTNANITTGTPVKVYAVPESIEMHYCRKI